MPKIEASRAVLLTESYRQTEAEPMSIRRTKAYRHILKQIPVIIREHELIAVSKLVSVMA